MEEIYLNRMIPTVSPEMVLARETLSPEFVRMMDSGEMEAFKLGTRNIDGILDTDLVKRLDTKEEVNELFTSKDKKDIEDAKKLVSMYKTYGQKTLKFSEPLLNTIKSYEAMEETFDT